MRIFGGAKKAAMFTTVKMPLAILGWGTFADNNKYIVSSIKALNAPTCPECLRGGMHCQVLEFEVRNSVDDERLNTLYPWHCSNRHCNYELFAPKDAKSAKEVITRQMYVKGQERLAEVDEDQLAKFKIHHKLKSRFFWCLGIVLLSLFIYRVASGARIDMCIGVLVIGLLSSLQALKSSYRAWQLETGTLFVEGAFRRFVLNENWIR